MNSINYFYFAVRNLCLHLNTDYMRVALFVPCYVDQFYPSIAIATLELLEKFGGPFTITEYRKNSKILGREYHKLVPPFLPTNFGFEEITNSKTNKNTNLSNLIYSASRNDNVVIKRNKPLNNVISRQIDYYVAEK